MKTKKLIQELKKEIEKLEVENKEMLSRKLNKKIAFNRLKIIKNRQKIVLLKSQLQFAEKLIKAIKEDIDKCREPLLKSEKGNSNTYFLDYKKVKKVLNDTFSDKNKSN